MPFLQYKIIEENEGKKNREEGKELFC